MKQAPSKKVGKRPSIPPVSATDQQLPPSQSESSPYTLPVATTSDQGSKQPQNPTKVAIPRLRRNSEDRSLSKGSAAMDKNRVAHACEPCRQRKTKCSGERPACQHCEDFKLQCVYADGKRDRTIKRVLVEKLVSLANS